MAHSESVSTETTIIIVLPFGVSNWRGPWPSQELEYVIVAVVQTAARFRDRVFLREDLGAGVFGIFARNWRVRFVNALNHSS